MNLSKIAQENFDEPKPEVDRTPWLRQKEGELVKVIEAIAAISECAEWQTLKTHIFDGLVESLERRLTEEANKPELNQSEIHRLQGQLAWAKRYADFKKLGDAFKLELGNIRNQLNKVR